MSKTEIFVSKAKEIHGDKYDYSLVAYVNNREKVRIVCPEHGEFEQSPGKHLDGQGCRKCGAERRGAERRLTTEQFVERAKSAHGNKYDYSKTVYVSALHPVTIICLEHGEFSQGPFHHMGGQGCSACGTALTAEKLGRGNQEDFLRKAKAIHGEFYDYSQVNYHLSKDKVIITCPIHGPFSQEAGKHVAGQGCPQCSAQRTGDFQRKSWDTFLAEAVAVHGGRYEYPVPVYVGANDPITAVCPSHGEFYPTASNHIRGSGCPRCSSNISKGQLEVGNFLSEIGVTYVPEFRLKSGKKLDFYCPERKVGIEYNGLYFHSSKSRLTLDKIAGVPDYYHASKSREASEEGILVVHIWEDEWRNRQQVVKSLLASKLGKSSGLRVFARNCEVVVLSVPDMASFLEENHMLGHGRPFKIRLGLSHLGKIVAVLCADAANRPPGEIEITRYATNVQVPGGFSKLLSRLKILCTGEYSRIVSFSEIRLSDGSMYEKTGFRLDGVSPPSYTYTKGSIRENKRGFQRSKLEEKLQVFNPELSERDNCEINGWFPIFDCGKKRWVIDL